MVMLDTTWGNRKLSVIRFSKDEIGKIAGSLFRNHRIWLWDEQERCMFIEHARHSNALFKNYDASEDTEQMNHLRWIFERVYLANQMQHCKNYAKGYGKKFIIDYDSIDMYYKDELSDLELHKQLYSLRYNSDDFLSKDDNEKLTKWINTLSQELLRKQRIELEDLEIKKQ